MSEGQVAGLDLRDRALDGLTVRRSLILAQLHADLSGWARTRALEGLPAEATADDATLLLASYPQAKGLDPRLIGAVWRLGGWEHTGRYIISRLRTRHGRRIPVWRWVGQAMEEIHGCAVAA